MATYRPDERRVSIFADNDAGRSLATSVATTFDMRIIHGGDVVTALDRLAEYPVGDIVLVDIAHDGAAALDVFLDRLDAIGLAERLPVFVNATPELLDRVVGRLGGPSVVFLCQATASDWISSLATLGTVRDVVLHDTTVDDTLRLQRLADDVQRIARTLADMVGSESQGLRGVSDTLIGFRADAAASDQSLEAVTATDVRALIRLRRMRDRFFTSELFADPAWDMLLDLMAARLERMRVAVSSLCIAAAVPPTTALRWIKTMTDSGMFVRVADPRDGRRIFIELSDGAARAMAAYLSAAKAGNGLAI